MNFVSESKRTDKIKKVKKKSSEIWKERERERVKYLHSHILAVQLKAFYAPPETPLSVIFVCTQIFVRAFSFILPFLSRSFHFLFLKNKISAFALIWLFHSTLLTHLHAHPLKQNFKAYKPCVKRFNQSHSHTICEKYHTFAIECEMWSQTHLALIK